MPIVKAAYPRPRRRGTLIGPGAGPLVSSTTSFEAPYVPETAAVVDRDALVMTRVWLEWARRLTGVIFQVQSEINTFPGFASGSLGEQPTGLGIDDKGLLYYVDAPYGHCCRWTGLVWEFVPGDPGNGFFAPRPIAPQENFWQECDGSATDYLRVGGSTLDVLGFTTPNLKGVATYLKSAAAYDGAVVPPAAPPMSGTPGISGILGPAGAHAHTGTTGTAGSHNHGGQVNPIVQNTGGVASVSDIGHAIETPGAPEVWRQHVHGMNHFHYMDADGNHAHTVTTEPDHVHGLGSVVLSAGSLAAGASDPQHLNVRVYFRR